MNSPVHVISRHWPVLTLTAVIIAVFFLVYALRSVLFPFILGLVIAYMLLPPIRWIERHLPGRADSRSWRALIILGIYIVALGLIGLFGFFIITTIVNSIRVIVESVPDFFTSALENVRRWAESIREALPPEMQAEIDNLLQQAAVAIGNTLREVFTRGIALIPTTAGMVLGLVTLPVFLFYLLKDWERLTRSFFSWLPEWAVRHASNIMTIIEQVFGRYIRAQLTLGVIVGTLVLTGLLILQVPFAPALAVFAAVTELIPIVGPWIGGAIGVLVALALLPDKVLWVAVMYVSIQVLENVFLAARIQGGYLRVHPAIAILVLVLGAHLAGFWGLILAVPVTATVAKLYAYVRETTAAEDSAEGPPSEGGATPPAAPGS